jgi:two-component system, LytTR family, response regulator LytT
MNDQQASSSRLRVLIVEDEWPAREYLSELLLLSQLADVVGAVATVDEAVQALGPDGIEVDVAFVDINLATSGGEEAGLALVRRFAKTQGAPLFVLATALPQHAVEAFDLDVVDYLLKPFSEERVAACLERVSRRRPWPAAATPGRIVARSKRGLVFLRPGEVWAFEASDRLTYLHGDAGRYFVDLSLATVAATLGEGWLRVHRNWVVNREHVKALERDELGSALLVGGTATGEAGLHVPVARDKLHEVRGILLDGTAGIRR